MFDYFCARIFTKTVFIFQINIFEFVKLSIFIKSKKSWIFLVPWFLKFSFVFCIFMVFAFFIYQFHMKISLNLCFLILNFCCGIFQIFLFFNTFLWFLYYHDFSFTLLAIFFLDPGDIFFFFMPDPCPVLVTIPLSLAHI